MAAMELVKDPESRTPVKSAAKAAENALQEGLVLLRPGSTGT